ncbi:MAG TPA: hypothetical protein VFO89_17610, partial [Thermoanaerobaculia bacterium]|nr:hypothetical protein [Thermoanaerobaculia bacterium]
MRIRYVLISEGSSDDALQAHLENLCIDQGAAEVTGIAPDFGRLPDRVGHSVEQKVRAAIELESTANLFFIHRDADDRRPEHRISEITAAVAGARLAQAHVPIVPVQATEAWLLLDESAIRRAAYRPDGTRPLGLPRPREVEKRADPKELLRTALAT